ncbi:MAG: DNA-binding protein [Deltaproteobacteria bacterium]|nr:DNA-binding protein [Deltaproteobacteria bacterium]
MKKTAVFATLFFLWAFAVSGALAPSKESGESRPGLFDPKTVETVSGIVVAVPPPAAKGGVPQPAHLALKTDRETLMVILGPAWFFERQGFAISALDKIQVTGSRVMFQGKPGLIAAEVKKGDRTLKLRDEKGTPLWGSPKP